MKKTLLLIAFATSASIFAQDLKSKKGEAILPEAGDYAIQFDASPLFSFIGNAFNGNTGNNAPGVGYVNGVPVSIRGKYFVASNKAYRGSLRLGFGSNKTSSPVFKDGQSDPTVTTDDVKKLGNTNVVLGGGLEFRKGKGRLQGFYGGELLIALSSTKETYTYGNSFSSTNIAPSTTDFGTNLMGSGRALSSKGGAGFGVGLRGFLGAEYFIIPKLSIGAEYGWSLGFVKNGAAEVEVESWDGATTSIKKTTTKGSSSSRFGVDTDINSFFGGTTGSLTLTLHF